MQSHDTVYRPRGALLPSRRSLSSIRFSSHSPFTTSAPQLPPDYRPATRSVLRSRSEILFNGTPIQVVSQQKLRHASACPSPKPAPYSPAPRSPELSSSPLPSTNCPHRMELPPPPSLPLPPSLEQLHYPLKETRDAPLSPLEHHQLLSDDDDDDDDVSSVESSSSDDSSNPPSPNNFFIHNGYRYDGDVFELRPPQERSIGSRPERVLEHKPLLLANRQTFNRVYSEGTFNARPSSLRQPVARVRRRQPNIDPADAAPHPPRKVTRPPSVRPPAVQVPPTAGNLAECIAAAKQNATVNGDDKLKGLLAYSPIPVTRQSGSPPPAFLPATTVAPVEPISMLHDDRENVKPLPPLDKRGRSYTLFAAHAVYDPEVDEKVSASAVLRSHKPLKTKSSKFGSSSGKGGWFREKEREKEKEKEKRPSFWKLLSR